MDNSNSSSVLKPIEKSPVKKNVWIIVSSFVVVLLGVGLGFFLSQQSSDEGVKSSSEVSTTALNEKGEVGISDETNFPDSAEGILVEGGISGEGTHHLERPGGASQNVYLTSTVIDLQSFVGKKVTIWGQTLSATKAGWLMDVGKLKISD